MSRSCDGSGYEWLSQLILIRPKSLLHSVPRNDIKQHTDHPHNKKHPCFHKDVFYFTQSLIVKQTIIEFKIDVTTSTRDFLKFGDMIPSQTLSEIWMTYTNEANFSKPCKITPIASQTNFYSAGE